MKQKTLKKSEAKNKKQLLKNKKLISNTKVLEDDEEIKKTIRMPKSLGAKLKIASTLTNRTQAEVIAFLLDTYMNVDDIYNTKLQPLLDQVESGEITMVKYKPSK